MKNSGIYLLLFVIIVFSSCGNHLRIEKRKYSTGYYFGSRSSNGNSEHTPRVETFEQDVVDGPSGDLIDKMCSESRSDSTQECILFAPETCGGEKTEYHVYNYSQPKDYGIVESRDPTIVRTGDPDDQESRNIRKAFWLSTASYLLLFTSLICLFFSPIVFGIVAAISVACGISGLILARRVRANHAKREKYDGRIKMFLAVVMGILSIAFAAGTIIILIGSSS